VHENLRTTGGIAVLPGAWIEHVPYESVAEHIEKMARYASLWGAQESAAGRRASLPDILLRPAWRLFRGAVLQLGILDGYQGIAASVSSAIYAYWKYVALREAVGRLDTKGGD
jgi:hypothetical protein